MPWGDYGSILLSGMTRHLSRCEGLLQLERTGPFIPPIIESGIDNIIVTNKLKRQLEKSRMTGFTFQSVIKKHIVHLDWHKWDLENDEPEIYPDEGEPEDYILDKSHSEKTSKKMGDVWEMCIEEAGQVVKSDKIYLKANTWTGKDIFMADGARYIYVTTKAKTWLENESDGWLRFEPAFVK